MFGTVCATLASEVNTGCGLVFYAEVSLEHVCCGTVCYKLRQVTHWVESDKQVLIDLTQLSRDPSPKC